MAPKVSVIMAAHNHAHFLDRSIGSVKEQTYQDYEFIVIDNGSTDQTKEKIAKLSWPKLKYVYQDDTGSVSGPRNTGIKLAEGEYVAFLDSDDNWTPDKLEKVMEVLASHPEIDVLTHDMCRRTSEKILNNIKVGPKRSGGVLNSLILDGNYMLGSATVVKTSAMRKINGFDGRPEFVHAEDYEAWLRLAEAGCKFYFLNETLGDLYVHSNNLSGDISRACIDLRNVINAHFFKAFPSPSFTRFYQYHRTIAITFCTEGRNWHEKGRRWKAVICYLRSLTFFPFSLRAWGFLGIAILHIEILLEKLNIYTLYSD